MMRLKLPILTIIAGTMLACGTTFPQILETPIVDDVIGISPTINHYEPVFHLLTITHDVKVRDVDTEEVVDWLKAGAHRWAVCAGKWCYIQKTEGMVWRGCTSDNPAELGCKAKP